MPMTGVTSRAINIGALVGFSLLPSTGILLYRVTAWTIYRSDFATIATDAYTFSLLAQFISTILFIFLERKRDYSFRQVQYLVVIASIVMALCGVGAILAASSFIPSSIIVLITCIFHGAASSILFLGWGSYTCSVEPRKSTLYVSFAFVLYAAMAFLLQKASFEWLVFLAGASPLLCGFLLLRCLRQNSASLDEEVRVDKKTLKKLPWSMFALLLACCIVSTITEIIAPLRDSADYFSFNFFWPILYLAIFAVFALWVFVLKRDDPDQLWLLFAFVLFAGLLGFSSFSFFDWDISARLLRATQDCLFLFSWVFIAGLVYRQKLPKVMFFGLGTILFLHLSPLPVAFFRWAFPQFHFESGNPIAVGLAFGMGLTLIVFTLILVSRRSNKLESGEKTTPEGSDITRSIDFISKEYKLSSRESEVAELLLRGYTLRQIGEKLLISHDTVRSHAKSIYRKLGIHQKQELIELAEKAQEK